MALRRAQQAGHEICALLTMCSPTNGTSRSHGLPRQLLTDQADALGVPLHVGYAGWADYEQEFKRCLGDLVSDGIELAVFGDTFLDDHRHWVERVSSEVGCEALEPLWGEATDRLLEEVIDAEIRAHICTVRPELVVPSWLGAALDHRFRRSFAAGQGDPCGEHGEYHTVVLNAPDVRHQIIVESAQVRVDTDHSHWNLRSWRTSPEGSPA
jgi:diphthine-ammonia ligase